MRVFSPLNANGLLKDFVFAAFVAIVFAEKQLIAII